MDLRSGSYIGPGAGKFAKWVALVAAHLDAAPTRRRPVCGITFAADVGAIPVGMVEPKVALRTVSGGCGFTCFSHEIEPPPPTQGADDPK